MHDMGKVPCGQQGPRKTDTQGFHARLPGATGTLSGCLYHTAGNTPMRVPDTWPVWSAQGERSLTLTADCSLSACRVVTDDTAVTFLPTPHPERRPADFHTESTQWMQPLLPTYTSSPSWSKPHWSFACPLGPLLCRTRGKMCAQHRGVVLGTRPAPRIGLRPFLLPPRCNRGRCFIILLLAIIITDCRWHHSDDLRKCCSDAVSAYVINRSFTSGGAS